LHHHCAGCIPVVAPDPYTIARVRWRALPCGFRPRFSSKQAGPAVMAIRSLLALFLSAAVAMAVSAQPTGSLRQGASEVSFVAKRFGVPTASGTFDHVDGAVSLDFERPERSRIRVRIETASLRTGTALVDVFIKGESMLDVSRYPTASFVSEQISRAGERNLVIRGRLTIRATTQQVSVNAIAERDPTALRPGERLPFRATTAFSRNAFGIGRDVNVVDDEVDLAIRGEILR
jgi:polyisoprenoid-binding protein YceI